MGAFYYAKNFGNFGRETNGTWKFSVQSGPPPQGVLFFTGRSALSETCRSISEILVSSPTLLGSSQNFGRNVNVSLDSIGNFISTENCLS